MYLPASAPPDNYQTRVSVSDGWTLVVYMAIDVMVLNRRRANAPPTSSVLFGRRQTRQAHPKRAAGHCALQQAAAAAAAFCYHGRAQLMLSLQYCLLCLMVLSPPFVLFHSLQHALV